MLIIHKFRLWQNSKTEMWHLKEIVIKQNCEKTQQLKLWQSLKTYIVTKIKNFNSEQMLKLKLWLNAKTKFVTKLKTWIVTKL